MKEILFSGIDKNMTDEYKINVLRENIQILLLKMLSDRGAFKNISFVGGTALRFIYSMNRFSEDLDFSLLSSKNFDYDKLRDGIKKDIEKTGVAHTIKKGGKSSVRYFFLNFPNLLFEVGASRIKAHNISVKIEIDMNPPDGWEIETSIINRFYIFQVNNYKIGSLFAGKLHACLFRKYVKARDYYDLFWYLTKKTKPNYILLNNAIKQTEKTKIKIDDKSIIPILVQKLEKLDFKTIKADVSKFLMDSKEAELLTKENFRKFIFENVW